MASHSALVIPFLLFLSLVVFHLLLFVHLSFFGVLFIFNADFNVIFDFSFGHIHDFDLNLDFLFMVVISGYVLSLSSPFEAPVNCSKGQDADEDSQGVV